MSPVAWTHWIRRLVPAVALALTGLAVAPMSSEAATGKVITTNGDALAVQSGPSLQANTQAWLSQGSTISFSCFEYGDTVVGPFGTENVWDRLDSGGYVSDAWIYTGSNGPVVGQCDAEQSSAPPQPVESFYNRNAAASWATAAWNHSELIRSGDCTWFVSQALWVGGIPSSSTWTKRSPNGVLGNDASAILKSLLRGGYSPTDPINPTPIATTADLLPNYLIQAGLASSMQRISWSDNTAGGAQLGDLILYDWDNGSNGTIDHIAIVTGFNASGYPTVTQHTPARLNRYWSYDPGSSSSHSGWIQDTHRGSTAYLLHITY